MNPPDLPLDRLFRAAAKAPRAALEPPPAILVARVLASRRNRPAPSEWAGLVPLLRGGFAVACALLTAALLLNLDAMRQRDVYRLDNWNSFANLSWMP